VEGKSKLKKYLSAFILVALVLLLVSYIKDNKGQSNEGIAPQSLTVPNENYDSSKEKHNKQDGSDFTYAIINKRYVFKDIVINYPQVSNLIDVKKQETINKLLKKEALKVLNYYDEKNKLELNIDYIIPIKSSKVISVQYSGLGFIDGAAHPNNLFYTINVSLDNGIKLRLVDLVKVDDVLVNQYRIGKCTHDKGYNTEEVKSVVSDVLARYTNKELINMFIDADSLNQIDTDKQSDTFSYLTKDSLGISISVGHSIGDHLELEIKLKDISKNIKVKNEF
jgi:hypothetical protein